MIRTRKSDMVDSDWEATWEGCLAAVPESTTARMVDEARALAARVVGDRRASIAWSGGKDSLALWGVLGELGLGPPHVTLAGDLEYPTFERWLSGSAPPGLIQVRTGQTWEWLRKHPAMLFPHARDLQKWYRVVQWAGQARLVANQKFAVVVNGRRYADDNKCGSKADNYCTVDARGLVTCSPLAAWSHAHIMAFLRRSGIALSPFYSWPHGWVLGTHPWAACCFYDEDASVRLPKGWGYVDGIDPSVRVRARAEGITGA